MGWLRSLDAAGMVQDYRRQAENMRNEVLDRALRQLRKGTPPEEVLNFLARTLTNKLLHTPSTQIRQAGFEGQMELLEAANTLFQIQDSDGGK